MIRFVESVAGRVSWPLVLVVLVGLMVTGCSKSEPSGTVQGTVTLDDAPYDASAVIFLDLKTGQAGSADIQPGGTFQLASPLPVGSYTVYLAPKAPAESDQPQAVKIDQSVPDKYWNEAASDIKIEVVEGKNEVQVSLKK